MGDWYKLYMEDIERRGGFKKYFDAKVKYRKKMLKKIEKAATSGKIVEAGCGSGVLAIKLCDMGHEVIAMDIDKRMLEITEKINNVVSDKKVELLQGDIFKIDKLLEKENVDIIFSVGVFEHYDDKIIIELLKKELKVSKYVFLAVPTKYFNDDEALYGNERFLLYKKWRELINLSNGEIISEFSCQNQNFFGIIKNVRKYFRVAPIRTFIIKGEKL